MMLLPLELSCFQKKRTQKLFTKSLFIRIINHRWFLSLHKYLFSLLVLFCTTITISPYQLLARFGERDFTFGVWIFFREVTVKDEGRCLVSLVKALPELLVEI